MKPILEMHDQKFSHTTTHATYTWGDPKQWVLFAGPDIFEDEAMVLEVAQELKRVTSELQIPWILKCSFDKANRQSLGSFRGTDLRKTFEGLARIKSKVGCDLITDVHETSHIENVKEIAEIIQIPAFLCRQTDLVVKAAQSGLPLHIKKGQFMAPWDMKSIVEKARSTGNQKILVCERGSSFGYNRLINDMTGLVEMRKYAPVVMDATHSVQLPGGLGGASDGRREMIAVLSRAAMAVGIDGLFLETHPKPENALCDGPNALHLKDMFDLLKRLQAIHKSLA